METGEPPPKGVDTGSLLSANAHAFNRQVLKLIHSKPAALRVVYYKRVLTELPPPMRRARRLLLRTPLCQV
ncbi:hypothetical protein Q5P01_018542 [Channa striata]|uniref:Uncharacterized protein n=1 Tax=Channa striata TaxID=64152 RepID=A0AA88M4V1_CHASR|nr:hypothetical protein Q5P01_018542 [Channa striata]